MELVQKFACEKPKVMAGIINDLAPSDLSNTSQQDTKSFTQTAAMRTSKRLPKTRLGINGGRWTLKEHEDFLVGLEKYGREWKKVASHISTRTSAQIRSHAQKYFAKLNKDFGGKSSENGSGVSDGDVSTSPSDSEEIGSTEIKSRMLAKTPDSKQSIQKKRKDQAFTGAQIRSTEPLSSSDIMIASLSPNTQKKVSSLEADEMCAVQVLASYAVRDGKRAKCVRTSNIHQESGLISE